MEFKKKLLIAIGSLFLTSCHSYEPGDCVTAPDGYIWKINQIKGFKYIATGFLESGWGNDVELDFNVIDRKNYKKGQCPEIKIKK